MTAVEEVPISAAGNPIGFGSMKRVEDQRFVRGQGNYVDDVNLPGMLHSAILRSPFAHARILSIDTSAAEALPGVVAVITGKMLEGIPRPSLLGDNFAWMPTLSYDTQAVLATDKVRFQGQEVAYVIAENRYIAKDALELIEVDYEPLPPVMDAKKALDPDAAVIRDDKGQTDNRITDVHGNQTWESGNKEATEAAFAAAEADPDCVVVEEDILYPRVHPAPMETCGSVSYLDKVTGQLTMYTTSQAPHAHRTVYAMVAGLPEHKIRIISPDIGGGFGNKVGVYPGYVLSVIGTIVTGKPVKWMEDRSENLMSTSFARDYHMKAKIAATKDGKILAVDVYVLADHGAFNGVAQPTNFPAGFFHIFSGSYDYPNAHCLVEPVYTNKAPGGVAYACSFRITEAAYVIERIVDCLAQELEMDPAELRLKNLIRPEQFPYTSPTGWEYDSGQYEKTMRLAMDMVGYDELRREQAEKRAKGEYMGIGISFFTEGVGAGPRKNMDILGLGMADGIELRVHPTGKAVLRLSVQSQGQGHETTFAQIVSHELGIPPEDIEVVHGDTDQTPFGPGHLRLALHAGLRRCGVGRRPQGPRPREDRRGGGTRVLARRPRVGARPLVRQGRQGAGQDDPGDRPAVARCAGAAGGRGGPPRRDGGLQPAEPHLPLRLLHLRRRRRSGHGPGQDPPVRRGGRLRHAHQPDDRRGPGARRARRRRGHGPDGAHSRSTRTATTSAAPSWTTCCPRRSSAPTGSWARR